MRPPQNAGESSQNTPQIPQEQGGFNEAPAERGGKLREALEAGRERVASMRPPQNAGESATASK